MVSRRVSRSVRRLVGGLVVLAFLAAVATPAQADPRDWSAPAAPELRILDWLQDILANLGLFTPEPAPEEPEEPRAVFGKDAGCLDPNGVPCPESEGFQLPPTPEPGADA